MKKTLFAVMLAASAITPAMAQDKQTATAVFIDKAGKDAGKATLTQGKAGVLLELEVSGLPANKWLAFHIHEKGSCEEKGGFDSAGGHFNPDKAEHGLLSANGPHAGDMPNQYVDSDGKMRAQIFNTMISIDDKNAVRGRAIIIHDMFDDYRSQPVGMAGKRLACAIIK